MTAILQLLGYLIDKLFPSPPREWLQAEVDVRFRELIAHLHSETGTTP